MIKSKSMTAKPLEKSDWYNNLLEDLKDIITEKTFSARMEVIEMKHLIGKRILQDELNFKRAGYGEQLIETIAQELNCSRTDLYLCVQFARKYPELSNAVGELPEGKNISWHKITTKYLAGNKENKEKKLEQKLDNTKLVYGIIQAWLDRLKIKTDKTEILGVSKKIVEKLKGGVK